METCPCGSGKTYAECCEPLIKGEQTAQSAESLMRSRYSAHVKSEIDYIADTTQKGQRSQIDRKRLQTWTQRSEWLGLEILATEGGPEDDTGTVEFIARYREKDRRVRHHEVATFIREDGRWFFKDGITPQAEQYVRQGAKIGRNDPCPCGSGKKYKKCCAV